MWFFFIFVQKEWDFNYCHYNDVPPIYVYLKYLNFKQSNTDFNSHIYRFQEHKVQILVKRISFKIEKEGGREIERNPVGNTQNNSQERKGESEREKKEVQTFKKNEKKT